MPDVPPKRDLVFSSDEYGARLDSLRDAMALQELDALILSDPANIAWTTGYDVVSLDAPTAAIVTMDGPPRWWGSARDGAGALATTYMADDRHATYAETDGRHPFADLAAQLASWGLGRARIGLELDSGALSAAAVGALIDGLGAARYLDATGLADVRRVVKSPAEIALMRRAAAGADAALERAIGAMAPGRATADVLNAMADLIGTDGAAPPTLLQGPEIAARALAAGGGALRRDATIAVVLGGAARRYGCPAARTVYLGDPPAALVDGATAAADAFDAAIAAARPGAPAGAVADAFFRELGGDAATAAIGYSVGLAWPPRWRERSLRVVAGADTELMEGMTLWLTVGPAELGAPLRIDETVLISEAGAEALCRTPRELTVKK